MNPYLDRLKIQKAAPHPLTQLTEAPSVSCVSASGRDFPRIDMPSVSSVSAMGSPFSEIDMVREFMEVDGLSLEEAQALAAVSIPPRPAAEWSAMLAELDTAIDQYCTAFALCDEAKGRIRDMRNQQSLASIPATLRWFKTELINQPTTKGFAS